MNRVRPVGEEIHVTLIVVRRPPGAGVWPSPALEGLMARGGPAAHPASGGSRKAGRRARGGLPVIGPVRWGYLALGLLCLGSAAALAAFM